jgi:5'-3' exoribonuclease 1
MNQQRGRRFRSAKDAEDARKKAAQKGEEIPDDPFDSNCITPGTVFMAELSKQLRYFINKKVSEDKDWQDVEIVLSGHEVCFSLLSVPDLKVPGEGEHKIMEYLRHAKVSRPGIF